GAARALARDSLEEALARRRALEHEGRSEEDGRFQRPFAELRVEAVAEHQGLGLELVIADLGGRRARWPVVRARAAGLVFGGQDGLLVGRGLGPSPKPGQAELGESAIR